MQMIVNELSARFPAESIEDGKQMMDSFLRTCFQVKGIIQNDSILMDQDYNSFELAPGYRIEQWRNDPGVDIEDKRRFRFLVNKSVVYNSGEFEQEQGWDFRTEFLHGQRSSRGCLLAYEMDGVAVSFLSSPHWRIEEIEGIYTELTDDGSLKESSVKIPNVSYDGNVDSFRGYYEEKRKAWRYTQIVSGQDILNLAPKVFPNLIFCENAVDGCRRSVGVSEAGQVYKRLLELQHAAENMGDTFDKSVLAKATPESGATLERFSEEHSFRLPDGSVQRFSWHVRFTGGYGGRIFFYPIPEEKLIYIGHVGHKLPTVKYH